MAATMCLRVDKVSWALRRFLLTGCRYSTSVQTVKDENHVDLYPPIKPKMPEGEWGSMKRRHAWLWTAKRKRMSKLNTVKKRIDALTDTDMKMWRFLVAENYPRCLPYQQYVTKTHLVDGLPKFYDDMDNVDEIVQRIKPIIMDSIALEHNILSKDKMLIRVAPWYRKQLDNRLFLKQLLGSITSSLCGDFPHLQTAQFDENVRVEAFWDRHGIRRMTIPRYTDEDRKGFEHVDDSRLQAKHRVDYLLRVEDPISEFLPREDELCTSGGYPELEYHPTTYGQLLNRKEKPSVVAGHWAGDPCEFSLVGVNLVSKLLPLADKYGETILQELITGLGINSSFVRLVAEAHYQGFNSVEELTYPFTTQTILTDGQTFHFFAYQLNTLELWKDDEANPLRNICWQSGPRKLFESVEDGEVKSFNEDVLKQMVKFLAVKPGRPGLQLRPDRLARSASAREKEEHEKYLNEKVKKVAVRKVETYI